MAAEITDPSLLSQLGAGDRPATGEVTDSALLEQLNASPDITPATAEGPARITVRPPGTEPTPPPSWGDIAQDVGLSTAIGVPKGLIAMAGLPEAVAGYGASALGYLTGQDPETFRDQGAARLPSTADIRGKVEDYTGPLYEPKTTYGPYGQAVGEFLPAALSGPGGAARAGLIPAARAIGGRIFGQAVIPGMASEGAQRGVTAAGFPEAAPYVGGGVALLTGMRGVGKADVAASEAAKQELLTRAPQETKAIYHVFDQAAAGRPLPLSVKMMTIQRMRNDLQNLNFPTDQAEKFVDKLAKKNVDVAGLNKWRADMRDDLYRSGQYQSAKVLSQNVDRAIDQSMPATAAQLPPSQLLQLADRTNAHNKLMEAITTRFDKVEGGTSATSSGLNFDNKLRQSLEAFKQDKRSWHALTDTERLKVDDIIKGGIPKNFLRYASNLAGGGGGMGKMVALWAAHHFLGGAGVAGIEAVSRLKFLENAKARREQRDLTADIMGRSEFALPNVRLQPVPIEQRTGRAIIYGGLPGALAPGDQ